MFIRGHGNLSRRHSPDRGFLLSAPWHAFLITGAGFPRGVPKLNGCGEGLHRGYCQLASVLSVRLGGYIDNPHTTLNALGTSCVDRTWLSRCAPHKWCSALVVPLLLFAAVAPLAGAAEQSLSDDEARALIAMIEQNAQWGEEGLSRMRSDYLDREVLLEELNYEPDAIEAWVAENTQWVPYVGRLRGADGVLMDRRGNSLDRSLLLAALLEDAGVETRLARTQLPRETAGKVLAEHAGERVRSVGPALGPSKGLRALHGELEEGSRALAALAGLDDQEVSDSNFDRQLAGVRDHWWVQAKKGPTWVDLDLLISDGSPFSRPVSQGFFSTADDLPLELDHSVTVKVVLERWQAGELFKEVALSYELTPRDALRGHTLELVFEPFAQGWQKDDSMVDAAPVELADDAELWLPVLRADFNKVEYGKWISRAGTLEKDPTRWAVDRKFDEATRAIAGLGAAKEQEKPQSHLTAVWLEYEVHRPGETTRHVRRELCDILGVDRRDTDSIRAWAIDDPKRRARGFAMQADSIALVSIATPQTVALERAIYQRWTENRSYFIALVYSAAGWEDERIVPSLATAKPYPVDLLGMMTARGLWSRHRDRIFADEINIWSNHLIWKQDPSSNEGILATDIVSNHVGTLASSQSETRLLRMEQGMLDTFIEQHLSPAASENAYGRFLGRKPIGGTWTPANSAGAKNWPRDLPAADRDRLQSAIEDGDRVVVADEIAEFDDRLFPYWWHVNPKDGTTLGRGYRGWGIEFSERNGIKIPSKVFDAAQKRGLVTRACKVGEAIVAISNIVVAIENPVMIDIAYVVQLEARSLYVTQTSAGISKICG